MKRVFKIIECVDLQSAHFAQECKGSNAAVDILLIKDCQAIFP